MTKAYVVIKFPLSTLILTMGYYAEISHIQYVTVLTMVSSY